VMRTRPLTTLQERDIVDVLAGFRLKKCQQDSGIKAGFPQASLRELNGGAPVDGDEAVGLIFSRKSPIPLNAGSRISTTIDPNLNHDPTESLSMSVPGSGQQSVLFTAASWRL